jgi:hypothetical protein
LLKAAIDELARRFATASAGGMGRQRLRERTEDLVLDLLEALKTASLGEIAETTRALERRRKTRVSARATIRAALSSAGEARKGEASHPSEESDAPERPAASARNPFEITVPSELLETPRAQGANGGHHQGPPRESSRKRTSDLIDVSAPTTAQTTTLQEPPPRTVALRAGEQLLRSGGAGAVIRRVRGS